VETVGGKRRLRVQFNTSLLGKDKVIVKPYNTSERASATFVRVTEKFPANAWRNFLYENRQPLWSDDSSWIHVDIKQSGDSGFLIDLTKVSGKTITGVKYGQGVPGMSPQSGHKRVCCGAHKALLL